MIILFHWLSIMSGMRNYILVDLGEIDCSDQRGDGSIYKYFDTYEECILSCVEQLETIFQSVVSPGFVLDFQKLQIFGDTHKLTKKLYDDIKDRFSNYEPVNVIGHSICGGVRYAHVFIILMNFNHKCDTISPRLHPTR